LIGSVIVAAYCSVSYGQNYYYSHYEELLAFGGICIAYLIFVTFLFINPLSRHREWVEMNGIFATKPKNITEAVALGEVDIIKGEKLKQYSVADELIKWAKLKEDGHISEEEFNEARKKLLKRA
jgi:membrane protein YdbS with pleckstrin-like domain